MIDAGVDIGSVATKAVVVTDGEARPLPAGPSGARNTVRRTANSESPAVHQDRRGLKVVGRAITRTGVNPPEAGEEVLNAALKEAGLTGDREARPLSTVAPGAHNQPPSRSPAMNPGASRTAGGRGLLDRIVTTGYGRRSVPFGDVAVTEITAAGRGAWFLGAPWGSARTVVDLGGQDSKVVLLEEPGVVPDFAMNDKCAAGTGRFLEVMAGVLGVELGEMGELSLRATDPVTINSTCTVFAESEVISLIAQGRRPADIAAGIHNSIASRLVTMVRQLAGDRVFFCGGGARNVGVQAALREALAAELYVPPDPQFVPALGAALIASDQLGNRS